MSKVTTIIVSWNTRMYLQKCLKSIELYFPTELNRTIVIDNNSSDGSVDMVRELFPYVKLVENSENVGFASACNQGMAQSESEIILLLNSDCEVTSESQFADIIQLFENDKSNGIIGPIILYPTGKIQSAGQKFTTIGKLVKQQLLFQASPLFSNRKISCKKNDCFEADYVSGSCMFIRKSVLEEVGLFNEALIMYAEDMDLCYRVKNAGFKVLVASGAFIVHHKSKSTNKNLSRALRLSVRNNCIFIKKQFSTRHAFVALNIYALGTAMRVALAFFRSSTSPKDWLLLLSQIPLLWKEILRFKI